MSARTARRMEDDAPQAEVWELIRTLVSGSVPANRILELYYWSQEPGALEMARDFLALSTENRALMRRFFELSDPRSISIHENGYHEITLTAKPSNGLPHSTG